MDRRAPDYIIDPDGEVIIILRNADSPFAQPLEDTVTGMALPEPSHATQSPAQRHSTIPGPEQIKDPSPEDPAAKEKIDEPLVENCFYIQVSAKHLMFSSCVFKSVLTSGWKESIEFQQKGSIELTAESWGIEEFLIVLRAIHGKYYHIPRKLTLEMLVKVAVIADYYECKEALLAMTDAWINKLEEKIPTTHSRDLMLWLWVSWFFQLPSQFKQITSTAMSSSENQINAWGAPDSRKGSMNKTREGAFNKLILRLRRTREAFLSGKCGCGFECRSIMYGALTMQMQSSHLLSRILRLPFPI
ncbi:hypothetical protein N7530_010675 [Penicillium desertorum]|uniref:BTB domain-containing protein n=1 Tax=Penicillium desertorum TaxID=1303715 RepID=A0A9X0BHU8_9EURO|nr:hypothetical protein N7530_010675 [Penicillium desertorum]